MEDVECALMYIKKENEKTRIPGTEQEAMPETFK